MQRRQSTGKERQRVKKEPGNSSHSTWEWMLLYLQEGSKRQGRVVKENKETKRGEQRDSVQRMNLNYFIYVFLFHLSISCWTEAGSHIFGLQVSGILLFRTGKTANTAIYDSINYAMKKYLGKLKLSGLVFCFVLFETACFHFLNYSGAAFSIAINLPSFRLIVKWGAATQQ